jgi:DNA-binding MarR family transcriptional regulator
MLFVIAQTNKWLGLSAHFVYQSDIWKALGVTPGVVCVMLESLEKLKLVRRQRSIADRRQVIVTLTRKARGLLRRVQTYVIKAGIVWRAIYSTFAMVSWDVGTFKMYLDDMRVKFKDTATFEYPWCRRTTHPRRWPPEDVPL